VLVLNTVTVGHRVQPGAAHVHALKAMASACAVIGLVQFAIRTTAEKQCSAACSLARTYCVAPSAL
jgi:hypothetical protein